MRLGPGIGIPKGFRRPAFDWYVDFQAIAQGAVPPDFTFTRATTRRYFDAAGVMQTAAIDVPAYMTDPVSGKRGFLREGTRTNLCLQSETFDNATWTKTRATITANAATAPDNAVTMDKLVENATPADNHQMEQVFTKAASALPYSYTVFIKAAERSLVLLRLDGGSATNKADAEFNVTTGVITVAANAAGTFTAPSAAIRLENAAQGIYRCTIRATTGTETTLRLKVFLVAVSGGLTYDGDGASGIHLWGAQLEQAASESSYIGPTTTASVSRSDDAMNMTGAPAAAIINNTEGTMWVEYSLLGGDSTFLSATRIAMGVTDGTNNERHNIYNGAGAARGFTVDDGVTQVTAELPGTIPVSTPVKVAYAYALNNSRAAKNGTLSALDSVCTMPTCDRIGIGAQHASSSPLFGLIHRAGYIRRRVSEADLEVLTYL